MKNLTFLATNKDGKKVTYQTIATYENEETKKNYIVYTDNTYDDSGKLKIYYSLYKIINEKMQLEEIISNEDKQIVLELVKELISEN